MLAYLDALIAAIAACDADAMTRLLADPMARVLTRAARHEVTARLAASINGTERGNRALAAPLAAPLGAPLRLLQLHHQTAQLLVGRADGDVLSEYRPQPPALRAPGRSQQSRRQRVSGRATNRSATGRRATATGERSGLLVEQLSEIDR